VVVEAGRKHDNRAIFSAAAHDQRAVDFLQKSPAAAADKMRPLSDVGVAGYS
jgi:hypothetical protein